MTQRNGFGVLTRDPVTGHYVGRADMGRDVDMDMRIKKLKHGKIAVRFSILPELKFPWEAGSGFLK